MNREDPRSIEPRRLVCGSPYGPDGSCTNPHCHGYYHPCDWECKYYTDKGERYCIAGIECPLFPCEDC